MTYTWTLWARQSNTQHVCLSLHNWTAHNIIVFALQQKGYPLVESSLKQQKFARHQQGKGSKYTSDLFGSTSDKCFLREAVLGQRSLNSKCALCSKKHAHTPHKKLLSSCIFCMLKDQNSSSVSPRERHIPGDCHTASNHTKASEETNFITSLCGLHTAP